MENICHLCQDGLKIGVFMGHRAWILVSGLIWAVVGFLLLYKGLRILNSLPNAEVATWWVASALLIGFFKGRFVLSKTAKRLIKRISSLPAPIRFMDVYPKGYWLLIASMMAMGFILRLVDAKWHGFIDVAVGAALINGAMFYFRASREVTA